jgi:hypothetical protein
LKSQDAKNCQEKKTLAGALLTIEIWQIGEDILD